MATENVSRKVGLPAGIPTGHCRIQVILSLPDRNQWLTARYMSAHCCCRRQITSSLPNKVNWSLPNTCRKR